MGANFAQNHKPAKGDEHVSFLTDPHEWYRHPAIRLFILFMVLFMDFFVYGQDPVQDSAVETSSLGCGQIVGLLAIWFAPDWQHKLAKAFCLVLSLLLATFFGKLMQRFMIRVAKFGAFRSDGGVVTCWIIGLAPAAFMVDALYNSTLHPTTEEIYFIDSRSMEFFQALFHLPTTSYADMGKMWQWISATLDWLAIFQIGDSIFQDTLFWPGFAPDFKKWYSRSYGGKFRIYFFRLGFPLMVLFTGLALNRTGPNKGQFNWEISGIKGTSEVTRSFCGALIIFLDLLCLVQDWEFPLFSEAHKEEEHKAFLAGLETNALQIGGMKITAKWLQYGPLLGIMGADFAFVKSMFQYTPTPYGQYVDPNDYRVWTIQNRSVIDVIYPLGSPTTDTSLLAGVTYAARRDIVTGEPLCTTCAFDTHTTAMFYDSSWDYAGAALGVLIFVSFMIIVRRANKTAIQEEIEVWGKVGTDRKAAAGMANQLAQQGMDASQGLVFGIKDYVERGPEAVSCLCFLGGVLIIAFGVLRISFGAVTAPARYLVNVCIVFMGVVTCLNEAPAGMVAEGSTAARWQQWCRREFKFLTHLGGRGFFYLFQGSLALSFEHGFATFLAWYMFGLGVLCLVIHYKIDPEHVLFGRREPTGWIRDEGIRDKGGSSDEGIRDEGIRDEYIRVNP